LLLELLGYLCHLRYLADLLVLVNPEHLEHLVDQFLLLVLPYQWHLGPLGYLWLRHLLEVLLVLVNLEHLEHLVDQFLLLVLPYQ
jgi:hypothetical protein